MVSRRTLLKVSGIASIASSVGSIASPVAAQQSGSERSSGSAGQNAPKPVEQKRIQLVGYDDLDGKRNAFKMGLQKLDGRWYLYLGHFWNPGFSIVDVTDPKDPVYENFIQVPPNTSSSQIAVANGLLINNLEPAFESHPFYDPSVEPTPGLQIWDISQNPTDPEHLTTYEIPCGGTHRNYYDGGDYAYLTAQPEGYDGHIPLILDISDPENPSEVSRTWWPGQAPDEEVTCPSNQGASLHGPMYPASAEDPETAYLPYGGAGMITGDISDIGDPQLVHQFDNGHFGDTFVGVHTAVQHPDTNVVWTSTETTSQGNAQTWTWVAAIDKSDCESTKVLSVLPHPTPKPGLPYDTYYEKGARFGPHNTHHWKYTDEHYRPDSIIPWTWFSAGLRLYDVSDFRAPKEVGYYVPENPDEFAPGAGAPSELVTSTESVLIDDRGFIYITDKNHGLHILRSDLISAQ